MLKVEKPAGGRGMPEFSLTSLATGQLNNTCPIDSRPSLFYVQIIRMQHLPIIVTKT